MQTLEGRLTNLLGAVKHEPTLHELRELRALQALELAGAKETTAVLHALASGAAGARLTEHARAAVRRLTK